MGKIREREDLRIMSTFVFVSLLEQLSSDTFSREKEALEGITKCYTYVCICVKYDNPIIYVPFNRKNANYIKSKNFVEPYLCQLYADNNVSRFGF